MFSLVDILSVYDQHLIPGALARKKLSLHLLSQQLQVEERQVARKWTIIKDEALFKASLDCSPAAVPLDQSSGDAVFGGVKGNDSRL